jgi:tetratricopeptide (TPR) repeat protein
MGRAPSTPPLLSAALIVRDEERVLGECLQSLTGVVDEIVVVDTGSVDASPAIAREHGARVIHHPWKNDFSEARNVSLDAAEGQWILYIDADERLVRGDRAVIESLLVDAPEIAYRILLQPVLDSSPYLEYRLWRNDPRIRFDGVIHEKVVPAIHEVAESDGRPISDTDELFLFHVGYEGDQSHKHKRNLPLLRKLLADEPQNLFAWHHLARILEAEGDLTGAEEALAEAVERARELTYTDPVAVLAYSDLIRLRRNRGAGTSELLEEARRLYPRNVVLLWYELGDLLHAGSYEEALARAEEILAFDPDQLPGDEPAYDLRIVRELAYDAKATCLFRLGDYGRAADTYSEAERCAPENERYRIKRQLALARAAKAEHAATPPARSAGAGTEPAARR